ncbi:MAG: hypothetical protein H6812_02460 [Phycisphaeraceae bacterium]|nr:hypothetical protein [Phycisphaeraceae bacterium]
MPSRLPEIELNNALVEFGENDATNYTPLATILVSGSLTASPSQPGVYTVDLAESSLNNAAAPITNPGAPSGGMRLDGIIDTKNRSGEITLRDADLQDWAARTAPLHTDSWGSIRNYALKVSAITYGFNLKEGVTATIDINDADLTIPIPAANPADTGSITTLAMTDVSGSIKFRGPEHGVLAVLAGNIEDLPCRVRLDTRSYSIDAPFDCTIEATNFMLGQRSALLPYAPQAVHDLLQRFSGPTAQLTANIIVKREQPQPADTTPQPIKSSGLVTFTNGAMRYEEFPYPISNVRGELEFTNNLIKMNRLSGAGPTGAKILASGTVIPDLVGPGLDLQIDAFGVPFDEHLLNTLTDIGHTEVQRIFNRDAYNRLIDANLVRDPASPAQDGAPPPMPLAGPVDISVHVTRSLGEAPSLATDFVITMESGGVACEVFPYPAILDAPLKLRITHDAVTINEAQLRGLTGGSITLNLNMLHDRPVDLDQHPDVLLTVRDVPVDRYLLHAVRETSSGARGGFGIGSHTDPARSDDSPADILSDPAALLNALNIEGVVSSEARISFPHDADTQYRATVNLDEISARPNNGQIMQGVDGQLVLDNAGIQLHAVTARLGAGTVQINGAVGINDGALDPASLRATIDCTSLPLETPLAPIAELFSRDWATRLQTIADQRRPSGLVDATLNLAADDVQHIAITAVDHASFDALDGRIAIDAFDGRIELADDEYHFRDASASVSFDDLPLGQLRVNGTITNKPDNPPLAITASDLAIGSPAVRNLMRSAAPGLVAWLEQNRVEGAAELTLNLVRADASAGDAGNAGGEGETGGWRAVSGSIAPSRLSMVIDDQPVELSRVAGAVRWDDATMTFDDVALAAADFSATLKGAIGIAGNTDAQMSLSLKAVGIPAPLRIIIPQRARALLDALSITCAGPIEINNATWTRTAGAESLDASINFADASFVTGVAAEHASGTAAVKLSPASDARPAAFSVDIDAQSLTLAGVNMNDARIEIRSDAQGNTVNIPVIRAEVHGGSMTGRASVAPDDAGKRRFDFSAELAGVPFSDVLADLESSDDSARKINRGTLEANLSLTGALDGPDRRGRGVVRVQGGDLLAMPGVVKLLELSNLQAPRGEMMEFGYADFFIQDARLVISDLAIMSPSIVVSGAGEIRWPDLDVNMNFRSQARSRVAFVSDILEGLRDEFVTTVARGTLYDPRLEFEQLAATRKFVETVFGGPQKKEPKRKNK